MALRGHAATTLLAAPNASFGEYLGGSTAKVARQMKNSGLSVIRDELSCV